MQPHAGDGSVGPGTPTMSRTSTALFRLREEEIPDSRRCPTFPW